MKTNRSTAELIFRSALLLVKLIGKLPKNTPIRSHISHDKRYCIIGIHEEENLITKQGSINFAMEADHLHVFIQTSSNMTRNELRTPETFQEIRIDIRLRWR